MEFHTMESEFRSVNCQNFRSLNYGIEILFYGLRKMTKRYLSSGSGKQNSIIKDPESLILNYGSGKI